VNVVLFDPTKTEGVRLQRALKDRGVPALLATDPLHCVAVAEQRRPELVLLCARAFSLDVLELAEKLRSQTVVEPAEIHLVSGPLTDDDTIRVFDAGIDGTMPWGLSEPHLMSRVSGVTRVQQRCQRRPDAPPFRAGEDGAELPLRLIYRAQAWRTAPTAFRDLVAQFFSHAAIPVHPDELPGDPDQRIAPAVPLLDEDGEPFIEQAAATLLTSNAHGVQIRVAVGAGEDSGDVLAARFFGDNADDLVDDMLAELSGVLAGALKSHFGSELLGFTAGLPLPLPAEEFLRPTATFVHQHRFGFDVGRGRIFVHLGMATRAITAIEVGALHEGMILATDLVGDHGDLLLRRGTRLSSSMVHRLRDLLSPRMNVQVMAA
jgi:DNA-binding response OmpR family regulator